MVRLKGAADPDLDAFAGVDAGLAELGRTVKGLRGAGCERVCFAGKVERLDPSKLKPDLAALKYLPGVVAAARQGDDALLRAILSVFEKEGFQIEGVGEAGRALLLGAGPLGRLSAGPEHDADIALALAEARAVVRSTRGRGPSPVTASASPPRAWMAPTPCWSGCRRPKGAAVCSSKFPSRTRTCAWMFPPSACALSKTPPARAWPGSSAGPAPCWSWTAPAVIEAADRLGLFVFGLEAAAP